MKTLQWSVLQDAPSQIDVEVEIIRKARTNAAEFVPLYELYFLRIYRYCLRRVGQAQDAEDLTSLIFTRAINGLASYRGGSVAAWLFRIAHNVVANHLRSQRPQLSLDMAESIVSHEPSCEQAVEDAELQAKIARLVAALPEDQRELLALKMAGQLSTKEIALVLGKSDGAIRVALHRIIQQLRERYEEES